MRTSWIAALVALLGCTACTWFGGQGRQWVVEPGGPRSGDPGLSALADRIYPGPQTSLRSRMSAALLADVDACPAGVNPQWAAEEALKDAVVRWREAETIDDATVSAIGRAIARAEGLAEAGREPELQRVLIDAYAALDERLDDTHAMFTGQRDVVHALMRGTAASLLRSHPDHAQVPAVLFTLSEAARRREDYALAAEILRLQVDRRGAAASTVELWTLAEACYRALAPACGDATTARLGAAGEDVTNLRWMAEQVDLARGPRPRAPEAQLDRGDALRGLGRPGDAAQMYRAAAELLPHDARPRLGLAQVALRRGDRDEARAQLVKASKLDHRGRDYHELAIALAWRSLTTQADAKAATLAELKVLAAGYRRYEPGRARVLEILLRAQDDGGEALAGDEQPAIAGLVAEFPNSRDARRLAYLAAQLAPTAEAALAAVRTPLPASLRELEGLRVRTWFDVAARWDRTADLTEIVATLETWPADARGELWATAMVAQAALSGAPVPESVTDYYMRVAEGSSQADRARAHNNLAVLQLQGDLEGAVKRGSDAAAVGSDPDIARLNMVATLVRHEPARADLPDLLQSFVDESHEVGLLAQAWRHELAEQTRGAVKGERTALLAQLREYKMANPGAALPGRWGVLAAPPRMDLGYDDDRLDGAEVGGLELAAEIRRDYWLIVPIDVAAASNVRVARSTNRVRSASAG